jgi:hypothetical protein
MPALFGAPPALAASPGQQTAIGGRSCTVELGFGPKVSGGAFAALFCQCLPAALLGAGTAAPENLMSGIRAPSSMGFLFGSWCNLQL